ncbi:Sfi1 spindle body domain containing protein [Rhypophila sp. PSN 637]
MPPKPSLPLRDGRVGLPTTHALSYSSSQSGDDDHDDRQRDQQQQQQLAPNNNNNNEPYYTDAEIELLNEIVTLGESIFHNLPEQNRLPTEALFTAAEEILPKHGYDADQPPPHISRFIFKIGGQRTGETLGDKFRTVLEGMGVEVEFVPTSPAGSTSVRSRRSSSAIQAETTPDLPILPFQAHVPVMERNRKPPSSFAFVQVPGELSEPEGRDASTIGDTEHVHPSPDTDASGVLGASEPSEQTRDDTPPRHDQPQLAPEDLQLLEGKVHQFKVQDGQKLRQKCLHNWRFNAIITRRDRGILELRASDWDDEDVFDEVLGIWREEALESQQAKVAAQVAAEQEAYVAKMERRAQRVYEILTVRNALSHWHDYAMDEVERTAVARRHLVRKRAFDGWRAQHIEDETKVQNFVLVYALQKWTQVMLHHEVRKQVSVQRHERTLAQSVISSMYEENKIRVADEYFYFKLGQQCLRTWFTRTREVQSEMETAEAGDNRLMLYEVLDIWREESEELQYRAYEGAMQFLAKNCLRDMAHWHEQARLKRTLRQCITNQIFASRNNVLAIWHHALLQRQTKNTLADSTLLRNPVTHWQLQTKLQIFQSIQAQRKKSAALKQWYLEERVRFFKRHLEHETQLSTLNTLQTLSRQSRNNRARARQEADAEYNYFSKLEVVDKWLSKAAESWKPRHNANLIHLYRTTMPVMEVWWEKLKFSAAKGQHERVKADVQARRAILGGVLTLWPQLAERKRRERLLGTLREFRRGYKIDLAAGCLDFWWETSREFLGNGQSADELLVQNKKEDVNAWIEHWAEKAQENQTVAEIAADAEIEVWCGIWQTQMEQMEELRGVAVNLDEENLLSGCWDRLEFQSLQRRAMARSVAAVREKNDLRFCGRVLEDWFAAVAIPDATLAGGTGEVSNLWSSSRRGLGQGLRTPAGASPNQAEDSLLLSLTGRDAARNLEQDFDDFDDDGEDDQPPDLGFMSTPTFERIAAVGGAGTTTPSAALSSPYERELRRVYGRGQTRATVGSGTGRAAQSVGPGGAAQGLGLALGQGQEQSRSLGPGGADTGLRSSLRGERTTETPRNGAAGGGGRAGRVVEFADIREESAEFEL